MGGGVELERVCQGRLEWVRARDRESWSLGDRERWREMEKGKEGREGGRE